MPRPAFFDDFVPSRHPRLSALVEIALRADALVEDRETALASGATSQDPAERYLPILLAQGWMDQIIFYLHGLRHLGGDPAFRPFVADATARLNSIFPGIAESSLLKYVAVEGDTVIAWQRAGFLEIRMDSAAAEGLMEITRTLVTAVLAHEAEITPA